jgi:hypothetical protein
MRAHPGRLLGREISDILARLLTRRLIGRLVSVAASNSMLGD